MEEKKKNSDGDIGVVIFSPWKSLLFFFFNLLNAISFYSDDEEERVLHQQQQQQSRQFNDPRRAIHYSHLGAYILLLIA